MGAIRSFILQVFFPKICANCSSVCEASSIVCSACYQNISFIERPLCVLCAMPLDNTTCSKCIHCVAKPSYIAEIAAVFEYNAHAQNMVLRLKYFDDTTHVAGYAQWMYHKGFALLHRADLIVPVPIHRLRLLSRKYNQSVLLARQIGWLSSKPLEVFALRKTRNTLPQNSLTAAQRAQNVLGSFTVTDARLVRGKVVILVDDVITTGATIQACAHALIDAGAREVLALTLGRTLPGYR
nr:ComF family protein [Anaplasma platys]